MLQEYMLGNTAGLLAEDDIGAVGVFHFAVALSRLGGKEKVVRPFCLFEEVVDRVIVGDIHQIPVVESRAF